MALFPKVNTQRVADQVSDFFLCDDFEHPRNYSRIVRRANVIMGLTGDSGDVTGIRGSGGAGGSSSGRLGPFSFSGGTSARSRGTSKFPTAAVSAKPSTDAAIKAKRIIVHFSESQDCSLFSAARAAASCRARSCSTAFSSAIRRLPLKRMASPGQAALAKKPAISS